MRRLAELFAASEPTLACAHGIDPGDAYALATRFDRHWGYRGGEALFWTEAVCAREAHDRYLPFAPLHPFEHRGFLQVDATYRSAPLSLVATSVGEDRATMLRDLRFTRSMLRAVAGAVVAFLANAAKAPTGFADLGFYTLERDDHNLIVVRPSQATPAPQTAGSHAASASIARI